MKLRQWGHQNVAKILAALLVALTCLTSILVLNPAPVSAQTKLSTQSITQGPTQRFIVSVASANDVDTMVAEARQAGSTVYNSFNNLTFGFSADLSAAQAMTLADDPRVVGLDLDEEITLDSIDLADPDADLVAGTPIPNRYIIILRPTSSRTASTDVLTILGNSIVMSFNSAFKGYVADLSTVQLKALKGNPAIQNIEQDQVVSVAGDQLNPPWGLDRIDQVNLPLDSHYIDRSTGAGVTAYVVDTGIAAHVEFGTRLVAGRNFSGTNSSTGDTSYIDCNGHGTHVAGTIGSTSYGVAKGVTLVPVRVLDCAGSGSTSSVIKGIDWSIADHQTGVPAVLNLSLGGGASSSLDTAVRNAVTDGIVVVVAAGNNNLSACNYSPSREPQAITVGASTSTDVRASFSNIGSCVDLFAPGQSIKSTWLSGSTNTISGTSMAAPHVAGAAAAIWGSNTGQTASQVNALTLGSVSTNKLTSVGTGSPNKLLYLDPGTGTTPSAPRTVTAVAGTNPGEATVSWLEPLQTGTSPINGYTATSSPGNLTCTWSTGPLSCVITQLLPNTSYTFTVTATNSWGTSGASLPSSAITVLASNDYFASAKLLSTTVGSINDTNVNATLEANEPVLDASTTGGGATVWYRFSPTDTGTLTIDTSGSNFDTVLTAYSGTALTTLTKLAFNDDYAGALTSSLRISVLQNVTYYFRVASWGTTRGSIKLNWSQQVGCTAVPAGNNFCAAIARTMVGQITSIDNTNFTTETDEPTSTIGTNGGSAWYTFRPNANGTLDLSTTGNTVPSVISVFTGSVITSLARPQGWIDTGGQNAYAAPALNVIKDALYYIRISSFDNTRGTLSLTHSFVATPVFTVPSAPVNVTAVPSTAAGTIDVSWQIPTSDGGTEITSYEASVSPSGQTCIAAAPAVTCSISGLTNWVGYSVSVAARNSVGRGPTSSAPGLIRPGTLDDFFATPRLIAGLSGTANTKTTYATAEPNEPNHAGYVASNSVWFDYTAPASGQIDISTAGSNFDTLLAVYTGNSLSSLTSIAANDDIKTDQSSAVSFTAVSGQRYRIAVDGYGGSSGNVTLNWNLKLPLPPQAPTNVVAVSSRTREAQVSWTAPSNVSPAITTYTVSSSPSGRTCIWSQGPLTCVLTGLTNGVSYTFTVVAQNAVGTSAPSAPSNAITPRTLIRIVTATQSWGIDRIDQVSPVLDGQLSTVNRGSEAIVFIVDTGIATNNEFVGRLLPGYQNVNDGRGTVDCQGHGTHVASTAVGTSYGVATEAKVVPVRVLNCLGSGYTSSIISGLDYIASYSLNGKRAVVNMSLGGSSNDALDAAVSTLIARGVVVVVAAGNESSLACDVSPARVPSAITVGATDDTDTRAFFSNYGSCVDIFAPGYDIEGASINASEGHTSKSGTSMAAPHVAGAAAIALTTFPSATPAQIGATLINDATAGVVTDAGANSPNRLLMVAGASLAVESSPATMKSISPQRIVDTRSGLGGVPVRQVGGEYILEVQITGRNNVASSGVTAVSLNVTATNAAGTGFLTVYPCGALPDVSSLNFTVGQTVPNAAVARLSDSGSVCFYSNVEVDLIVDLNGSLFDGNGFTPTSPSRLIDTRSGIGGVAIQKVGLPDGSGAPIEIPILGRNGLSSSGVTAVSMNVTVTGTTATDVGGYVSVYPCGSRPDVSNLNFVSGQTVANAVITPVSSTGTICIYIYGNADVIVDINGSFESGLGFKSVTPHRVTDTRSGRGGVTATTFGDLFGLATPLEVVVTGTTGIPSSGVTAVSLNVTALGIATNAYGGYVTVYPCDSLPNASNLNFIAGQIVPNAVVAPVSARGSVCFFLYGIADILVDVNGYISPVA